MRSHTKTLPILQPMLAEQESQTVLQGVGPLLEINTEQDIAAAVQRVKKDELVL